MSEASPLLGRRIVVTRARSQASELVERLRALGAEPLELPTIAIAEPDDGGAALRRAVDDLERYDWVVVTSTNGAERLVASLDSRLIPARVAVAAVGPGTAEVLRAAGVTVDLVPPEFVAESLLTALPAPPPQGRGRVLLAVAAGARDVLPRGLAAAGWALDVVEAYRTVAATPGPEQLEAAREADAITFTASSTVTSYLAVAGAESVPPVVVCIGPITADTARAAGLEVGAVASEHTIAGLVAALVEVLA